MIAGWVWVWQYLQSLQRRKVDYNLCYCIWKENQRKLVSVPRSESCFDKCTKYECLARGLNLSVKWATPEIDVCYWFSPYFEIFAKKYCSKYIVHFTQYLQNKTWDSAKCCVSLGNIVWVFLLIFSCFILWLWTVLFRIYCFDAFTDVKLC